MKKIISLFARNYDGDRLVRDELISGAEWVVAGKGIATRKFDGTCCMVRDGKLFKRYDVKKGKSAPAGFEPTQDPDDETGHWPGWLSVGNGPEDNWHREAWEASGMLQDGTYELCGPRIQKNPEGYDKHVLIRHGVEVLEDCPRSYEQLREYLSTRNIDGVVWHHPDGRMVKIKAKDFGLKITS